MVVREVSKMSSSGNLQVNETKTDAITLKRSNNDTEGWQKIKKLESLLREKEDIKNRKRLINIALTKLEYIWLDRRNFFIQRRAKLYNMLAKSILLYNCSTWGMTIQDEQQLDSFHRKQLRRILNIRWPHKIRNKKLYDKTNSKPVSIEMTRRRWNLLGHILRLDKETLARKAMKFMFAERSNKTFRGRKRATIYTTINRHIKKTKENNPSFTFGEIKSEIDLHNTEIKARNKTHWNIIVKQVVQAAYSNTSIHQQQ